MVRNVANLCVNTDHSLLAALAYAVNVLEVRLRALEHGAAAGDVDLFRRRRRPCCVLERRTDRVRQTASTIAVAGECLGLNAEPMCFLFLFRHKFPPRLWVLLVCTFDRVSVFFSIDRATQRPFETTSVSARLAENASDNHVAGLCVFPSQTGVCRSLTSSCAGTTAVAASVRQWRTSTTDSLSTGC